LSPTSINDLISEIQNIYGFTSHCEISLEAHPLTVDLKKLQGFYRAGINRLSLGFQSLNDQDLLSIKRNHRATVSHRVFQEAREVGFHNISCDLMFGLPGQNMIEWQETLDSLLQLKPNHLSLYALTIEEKTPLQTAILSGTAEPPEEETQLNMYDWACARLEDEGFFPYEISNFSKPGYESSHNRLYWRRGDYLGLGCSAHSSLGEFRFSNVKTPEVYRQAIHQKGHGVIEKETLSTEKRFIEALVFGLRQNQGISLPQLETRFSFSIPPSIHERMEKLQREGLISVSSLPDSQSGKCIEAPHGTQRACLSLPIPASPAGRRQPGDRQGIQRAVRVQLTQTGTHLADEVALQLLTHDSHGRN
jgi:oxygen-independent coproporphyrinogen-3 oxidase